jgi:hypothetical protein
MLSGIYGQSGCEKMFDRKLATAAAHMREAGSSMIASGLAISRFVVGLRVGHALIDALDNLLLAKPGIFQAADFGAAQRAPALQSSAQN